MTQRAQTDPDQPVCYAIRRVNPFGGVLQVIELPAGRAISANGIVWDIEVSAHNAADWELVQGAKPEPVYMRYGLWSVEEGLVNRPLAPHLENDPLARQCDLIIDAISQNIAKLPFKLEDNTELWLFDRDGKTPIALLASVKANARRPAPEPRFWSSCLGAKGVPSQRRFKDAEALELQVKNRAGFNINKFWVHRQADGSGYLEFNELKLEAYEFPALLLTETWEDAQQSNRVRQYLDWTVPALLTLQRLQREQRLRLEQKLHIQAVSVEHHWHLYPGIVEQRLINAARVQCQLQQPG